MTDNLRAMTEAITSKNRSILRLIVRYRVLLSVFSVVFIAAGVNAFFLHPVNVVQINLVFDSLLLISSGGMFHSVREQCDQLLDLANGIFRDIDARHEEAHGIYIRLFFSVLASFLGLVGILIAR
ncbi:hypothetical protein [Candidatus Thiosymbion oneisti]|uniref:hypothetical protein n=1 Tax=Candidatus Thiosymbion oneisti TaxID=589554 RepID=UPI000B7F48CB|nr:hypothetical protein [Candidatus Thiosymbion oneisti]